MHQTCEESRFGFSTPENTSANANRTFGKRARYSDAPFVFDVMGAANQSHEPRVTTYYA